MALDDDQGGNIMDGFGRTTLHLAIYYDRGDMVQALPNSLSCTATNPTDTFGNSALHIAAEYGRVDIASWLLDNHHETVNQRNHRNVTPLDFALAESRDEVIEARRQAIAERLQNSNT